MSRVFISYRRADCSELANALSNNLKKHLPEAAVFLDVEHIEMGEDFSSAIFKHISNCEIVILLIGSKWIDAISCINKAENDWVKMEIETALRLNKIVIPIITEPNSDFYTMKLPGSIKDLRRLNCIEIHTIDEAQLVQVSLAARDKLERSKQTRIKNLAKKITKSPAAIHHVWNAINYAIEQGALEPDPDDIWQAVIHLAQRDYGETKWKRVLKNYRLEQSEDVGLIIFACIIEGFFIGSEEDNPSDYWGLGTIHDIQQ